MLASLMTPVCETLYELQFNRRLDNQCGYKFACDAHGQVDMTALTETALNNYLFARAVSGNQLLAPVVVQGLPIRQKPALNWRARSALAFVNAQTTDSLPHKLLYKDSEHQGHHMKHTQRNTTRHALRALIVLFGMAAQIASAASLMLTGEQEVPPVITSGNGTGELQVASDGTISGSITTHGVPGTMAHIHQGAIGTNGPVVITLNKGEGDVWTVPPLSKLTADQLSLYRSGGLYVNVHTAVHKGGEIRAQLAD